VVVPPEAAPRDPLRPSFRCQLNHPYLRVHYWHCWDRLAQSGQKAQGARGGLLVGLMALGWLVTRRWRSLRADTLGLAWAFAVVGASYPATLLCLGRFDSAGLRSTGAFVGTEAAALLVVLCLTFLTHLVLWRDVGRLLVDAQRLLGLQVAMVVAHIVAFGWPVGYTGCFLIGVTALRSPLRRSFTKTRKTPRSGG